MTDLFKCYGPFDIGAFTAGTRVELHPACDLWMRGARFGTVISVGRTLLRIQLDNVKRPIKLHTRHIGAII